MYLHLVEPATETTKPDPTKAAVVFAIGNRTTCLPCTIAYAIQGWHKFPARILFDSCAQMSLVSEAFVRNYRIPTF